MAEAERNEAVKAFQQGLEGVKEENPDKVEKIRDAIAGFEQHMQKQKRLAEQLNEQELPMQFPVGRDAKKPGTDNTTQEGGK